MSDLLTQEQVDELPVGTKVIVTWSGGNGPHEYTISEHWGEYACVDNPYKDPLTLVGDERWATHVSLA